MAKLRWNRIKGRMTEQVTTDGRYRIWLGVWTKYNVYLLINDSGNHKDYIRIGGARTITECKEIAEKHNKNQTRVYLMK